MRVTRPQREALVVFFFILAAYSALPNSAHAYLDPGTGSMALQLLVAGIVGAFFTLKMYWRKAKDFVFGLFRKSGSPS